MNRSGQRLALSTLMFFGLVGCHYFAPCPRDCGYGACVEPWQTGCGAHSQGGRTCGCDSGGQCDGRSRWSRFGNRRQDRRHDARCGGGGCDCGCGCGAAFAGWSPGCGPCGGCDPCMSACDPCMTACDPCGFHEGCGDAQFGGCGMGFPTGYGSWDGIPMDGATWESGGGCPMTDGTYAVQPGFDGGMAPNSYSPMLTPAPPSSYAEPVPSPAPGVEEGQFYAPRNLQQPSKRDANESAHFAPSASRPVQQAMWVPAHL